MSKGVLCPVHNVKMKKVEIIYGFLFNKAIKEYFDELKKK